MRCCLLWVLACTLACGDDVRPFGSDADGRDGARSDGGAQSDAGGGDAGGGDTGGQPRCPPEPSTDPLVVHTTYGSVRGQLAGQSAAFRGLRYAAPPTGSARFRPAESPACFSGVQDAFEFGAKCAQRGVAGTDGDEDCLFLNVFAPNPIEPSQRRPVLFFIHGGANVVGAANDSAGGTTPLYDGRFFAEHESVVVVTVNYRLGALGFLAHPALTAEPPEGISGNYAILDLVLALEWVQDNIEAFGGDPERVMIFGESAGALNTCVLVSSPLAEGLFSTALMQSGTCELPTLAEAEEVGRGVVQRLGCATAQNVSACLRSASVDDLVADNPIGLDPLAGWALPYGPNIDAVILPEAPLDRMAAGRHNHVPFVVGSNAHETELFTPPTVNTCIDYELALQLAFPGLESEIRNLYPCLDYTFARWAYVDVTTDLMFTCPARRIARALAAGQTESTFRYLYSYIRADPTVAALRAFHAGELALVFGTYDRLGYIPTQSERDLSRRIQGYWARFAASGDPNTAVADPWARYDPIADNAIVLDRNPGEMQSIKTARCDFWDSLVQ